MSTIKDKVHNLSEAKSIMYKNFNDVGPSDPSILSNPKTKRDEI